MIDKDKERALLVNLNERIVKLSEDMEKTGIAEYVAMLQRPRRMIILNMIGGISRGVGIAIGLTLFTSTILYILRALGALNLPIIGGLIADIVQHVQTELEGRRF